MTANLMSERTTRTLRVAGWSLALALLALPAVAMQFTSEVAWTASDFLFAGAVFAVVGGLFELAARASANIAYRAAVVVAVGCAFLQLWITLAVGIIGSEENPANWTYLAMVLMAISAAAVTQGKARSMARATIALLLLQALFSAIHLVDEHFTLVIDAFFGALWFLSSRLFARAAKETAAA